MIGCRLPSETRFHTDCERPTYATAHKEWRPLAEYRSFGAADVWRAVKEWLESEDTKLPKHADKTLEDHSDS